MRDLRAVFPKFYGDGKSLLRSKRNLPIHMRTRLYDHRKNKDMKENPSAVQLELPIVPPASRIPYWNVFKGDYVHVHSGPHKGKWGRVLDTNKYTNGVTIDGVNVRSIEIPSYLLRSPPEDGKDPVVDLAHEIPYSQIQLLANATNADGKRVFVPVEAISKSNSPGDRKLVPPNYEGIDNKDVHLPVPKEDEPQRPDGVMDTKESTVAKVTWSPSLTEPPMPPFAVGDLRVNWSRRLERAWAYNKNKKSILEIAKNLVRAENAAEAFVKRYPDHVTQKKPSS
ncbi:ribosomal protein subunit L40 [Schizosaccharomyces cryophilus OY26]|uniref:Ribosomal protein subunit L40 n=1 Tax=Schizosaccharomyces cryophilus (strain OY26 / ATCC MYA-4695 / CBS 11777 / NBRC 106824 / NRRL Y48691) TaxID=653667 RepID=S9W266_SCHCR|nr:ribosomal protein subunit L40 [Schizosaccharomyces cryophilus OY26]EPY52449.1 ribosomal protein subunit L40 [Schizosaccharomyces cryophilus OY26]